MSLLPPSDSIWGLGEGGGQKPELVKGRRDKSIGQEERKEGSCFSFSASCLQLGEDLTLRHIWNFDNVGLDTFNIASGLGLRI